MAKYMPDADKSEILTLSAYNGSLALEQVLKQCGDNLTRENIMRQAASLDFEIDTYLPGIRVKTSPTDFDPIEQLQMMKFTGEKWETFGPLIDSHQE
jgi:branched-chain amino acid transport system substrate-binding protein